MQNLIRPREPRIRTAGLVVLATAAVVAIGVGDANAASTDQVQAVVNRGALIVNGTNADEEIVLRLRAGEPTILEVVTPSGVLPFARDTFTKIAVKGGGGDDLLRIDETNGAFTNTEETFLAGESGDDDLRGGSAAETLVGGSDDDETDGNQGADIAVLGSGDDSFTWDPGDGSDTVEGQRGTDTLVFNGSGAAESFDASANGKRLRFFRNVGNIVMDVDGTEHVDLRSLGGADNTVVNDLGLTDVDVVEIDLASVLGGSAGDGQADTVALFGSDRRGRGDEVQVQGADGNATVSGLSALVRITRAEASLDLLTINTVAGDDAVSAAALASSAIKLALDGGRDDDVLFGSTASDVISGGDGNDNVDGNQGNDTASLGSGDDSFTWDPGDGSDVVEGQDGSDAMIFNGSGASEAFEYLANGPRLRFTRNVGNIVMDVDDVEQVALEALGGADVATVNDLTGTDVTETKIDLEGAIGSRSADGQPDQIVVNGTPGPDRVSITGWGRVKVDGLAADVEIVHAEGANDQLTVNTLAGTDAVNAGSLAAGTIRLTIDGGADSDSLSGSRGGDTLLGGAAVDLLAGNAGDDDVVGGTGNDTAQLGRGEDDFTWDPGDGNDTVEGGRGSDTLVFNGSGASESFDASANGRRVRFFRNVGNIVMDLDDTERIDLRTLGGADQTTVNNLSGTDVKNVEVDLAGAVGGSAGDGAADTVAVNATNGVDRIDIDAVGGETVVSGLAATTRIAHAEPLLDQLIVNTLAGVDQVDVGAGVSALIGVTVNP